MYILICCRFFPTICLGNYIKVLATARLKLQGLPVKTKFSLLFNGESDVCHTWNFALTWHLEVAPRLQKIRFRTKVNTCIRLLARSLMLWHSQKSPGANVHSPAPPSASKLAVCQALVTHNTILRACTNTYREKSKWCVLISSPEINIILVKCQPKYMWSFMFLNVNDTTCDNGINVTDKIIALRSTDQRWYTYETAHWSFMLSRK